MHGLLALDCAQRLGWAFAPDDAIPPDAGPLLALGAGRQIRYGIKEFTGTLGSRLSQFYCWLETVDQEAGFKTIVFEAPFVQFRGPVNRSLVAYAGLVEMFCHDYSIRVFEAPVSTVKKHFTGKGNATKREMLQMAHARGWKPQDDNAADALALLDYALATFHAARRAA